MMKITTEAYDAYGNPLPEETYDAVSSFAVDSTGRDLPLVLGLWVAKPGTEDVNRVEPIYLTEEQRQALVDKMK